MCQRQAVKFSHVIHIRSEGGCEEEEIRREVEGGREAEEEGGCDKGWSDAVSVIKPGRLGADHLGFWRTETFQFDIFL